MMLRGVALFTGLLLVLVALCTPAGALGTWWVKYQHTSSKPAFTIEYPSGWSVNTSRKASNYTLGELVFPGQTVVAFETKAGADTLECGVKIYGIPGNVAGSDMLMPFDALGSANGLTVSKLHGQDYLQKTDTPTVNGSRRTIWRNLFLGDSHLYMVYMDIPTWLARQQPACQQTYSSMMRSFTTTDWPLKTINQAAAADPIPITVINASTKHIAVYFPHANGE